MDERFPLRRVFSRWLTGSALLWCGCTCSADEPGRTWESTHFRYHSRADDTSVCEVVTQTLEDHFQVLHGYLGFPWPEGAQLDYRKYRDARDIAVSGHCSDGNAACYLPSRGIEAQQVINEHELLHAYLSYLGDSHPALEEGVAEALSCSNKLRVPLERGDLAALTDPSVWKSAAPPQLKQLYEQAAHLVAQLLQGRGPEPFMKLYDRLTPEDGPDQFSAAFEEIYAEPVLQVWERVLAGTAADPGCVRLWECAAPPLEAPPGPRWGNTCDATALRRTITTTQAMLITEATAGSSLRVGSCDASQVMPQSTWRDAVKGGDSGAEFVLLVPKGKYFVAAPQDLRGDAAVDATPASQAVGSDGSCTALRAVDVSAATDVTLAVDTAALPGAGKHWFALNLRAGGGAFSVTCSTGVSAQVCGGCEPATCRNVCGSAATPNVELSPVTKVAAESTAPGNFWVRLSRRR